MPDLGQKVENASQAVRALIALLERCRENSWAAHFYPIADALEACEIDKAIALFELIPMPNMGGFLDLVLSEQNGHEVRDYEQDNNLLNACRSSVSKTIGNLRVFVEYELDYPTVEVPDAT